METTNATDKKRAAKKKAMIKALKNSLGVITPACVAVNIDRTTHYRWLQEDEEYKNAVADVSEIAIDFVENKLFSNIRNSDTTSIIFYLKTKGKARGYVEKHEIESSVKGSISVEEWIKNRPKND